MTMKPQPMMTIGPVNPCPNACGSHLVGLGQAKLAHPPAESQDSGPHAVAASEAGSAAVVAGGGGETEGALVASFAVSPVPGLSDRALASTGEASMPPGCSLEPPSWVTRAVQAATAPSAAMKPVTTS